MGTGPVGIAICLVVFNFSTREKSFYCLFSLTVITCLNQEIKQIYHQPRPYMTIEEVEVLKCSKSFGNPSGHSSLSACFYLTLFLLYFHDHRNTTVEDNDLLTGWTGSKEF